MLTHNPSTTRNAVALFALLATLVINPAYLTGCGMCWGDPPTFKYSTEDMADNLSTYAGVPQEYTLTSSDGRLDFTIELDAIEVATLHTTSSPSQLACQALPSLIADAMACSYVDMQQLEVGGVFTATWKPTDGEPVTLHERERFGGTYTVWGYDELDNGTIDNFGATPSFELTTPTGAAEDFSLEEFSTEHDGQTLRFDTQ